MTESSQLTIDGRDAPCVAAQTDDQPHAFDALPLFTAPATIRGQLAMPTDTETR